MIEVADGNDGALKAGIVVAAPMKLFILKRPCTLVGTDRDHISIVSSIAVIKKCKPYRTKAGRPAGIDSISKLDVGLPTTKLLMRLTDKIIMVLCCARFNDCIGFVFIV